jgi:hypothetical protein
MQDRDSLWVQVKSKRNVQTTTEMKISEVNADGAWSKGAGSSSGHQECVLRVIKLVLVKHGRLQGQALSDLIQKRQTSKQ